MADGDERTLDMPEGKGKWTVIEESILASGAEVVECLDGQGHIKRTKRIDEFSEAGDSGPGGMRDALDKEMASRDSAIGAERKGMALFAREYGAQLNEAFERGAAAANTGQEHLVSLVDVLTRHLAVAITSLHNVSANLVALTQAAGSDGESGTDTTKLLGTVLSLAAARAGMSPPATETPNGKGKK